MLKKGGGKEKGAVWGYKNRELRYCIIKENNDSNVADVTR